MKNLIFAVIAATLFVSCSQKEILPAPKHEKSDYRVLLYGTTTDTTISSVMFARTETIGLLVVEDDKLKAELMSYYKQPDGQGVYTVKLTNKQNCQVISRWHWEGLTIDSISPGNDVLLANQSIIFTLLGDAQVGKIKVKTFGDCGNSSELVLNITMNILPVKIIENAGSYDEKTKKTTISFVVDDPTMFDWILVQRYHESLWMQALLIGCDHSTKNYSIKL